METFLRSTRGRRIADFSVEPDMQAAFTSRPDAIDSPAQSARNSRRPRCAGARKRILGALSLLPLLPLLPLLLCGCKAGTVPPVSADAPAPATTEDPRPPCGPPLPASSAAEYTLRWMTSSTSLTQADKELKEVLGRLQHGAATPAELPEARTFAVSYYDVAENDWPAGYKASLRQRLEQKDGKSKTELTYKVRGPAPLPADFPEVRVCRCNKVDTEQETDIALALNPKDSVRNAGISCSVDPRKLSPLPAAFAPTTAARPCEISMTRYKLPGPVPASGAREDLKIEYWTFKPRAKETRALIEISWKASIVAEDERAFRAAVAPLQEKLQAQPIAGKEQTALSCDADWAS